MEIRAPCSIIFIEQVDKFSTKKKSNSQYICSILAIKPGLLHHKMIVPKKTT